jgi:hypothetical protein
MSRSYKKNPVTAITTADSEKEDKRSAHATLRMHFRTGMAASVPEDDPLFDERNRAHSEIFLHAKDGKTRADLRLSHIGRAVRVLANPRADLRKIHKLVAK